MKKIVDIIKEEILKINEEKMYPYFTVSFETAGYFEPPLGIPSYDRYKFHTYEDAIKALMEYFKTSDALLFFKEHPDEVIEIAKQTPVKNQERARYTVLKKFTIDDYDKFVKKNNEKSIYELTVDEYEIFKATGKLPLKEEELLKFFTEEFNKKFPVIKKVPANEVTQGDVFEKNIGGDRIRFVATGSLGMRKGHTLGHIPYYLPVSVIDIDNPNSFYKDYLMKDITLPIRKITGRFSTVDYLGTYQNLYRDNDND